jgi:NHS family xanthosine MFS transporter
MKDWHMIWLAFAGYSLVIAIAFAILFKHEHNPNDVENLDH